MKKYLLNTLLLLTLFCFAGCKITFNGASIPPEMKSINVRFFENNAPLVVADLAQSFTEELKSRIRNQTRLAITQGEADAVFEGRITGYSIAPTAIGDNKQPTAGANRLSITVSVKYTNNLNEKLSFEESFTRFKDFPQSGLATAPPQLNVDVNRMLTEDIFNRAFAQW
ncbi:LptE family protein [Pedobacter sp. SYP-B3415]|uniref:LptE family protein n=1 Tax=Pedobacter sp. SYP-B3415 TaxID=2496641 RepID=UPI00101B744A|nr:LptE family protein [Pedobacter sp. SYP-B3415]